MKNSMSLKAERAHRVRGPLLHARNLLSVCRYEIRLQLSSVASWLCALIICLYMGVINWNMSHNPDMEYYQETVRQGTGALGILLFLLPFLCLLLFRRDRQRKITALLWTRPLSTTSYVVGKWLAISLLSCLIGWLALLVGWMMFCVVLKTVVSLDPWLLLAAIYAVRIPLVVGVALFGICLAPFPLLGVVLTSALVIYHFLFSVHSMLDPLNLTATTLYYSGSIGTGPDGALLWAQTGVMAGLALAALALAVLCFPLREPQAMARLGDRLMPLVLLVLCVALLVPGLLNIQQTSASYRSLGKNPVEPVAARVSQFHVSATIDPKAGTIDGTSTFTVTPERGGLTSFPFALNRGLTIQQLTQGSASLPFHSSAGWTQVELAHTPAAKGEPITLTVHYRGSLVFGRNVYGMTGGGKQADSVNPLPFMSYIGQGLAFLEGAGSNWYPLLWTQEAVQQAFRLPLDTLHVRFPASYQVLSSLGTVRRSADGQWLEVVQQTRMRFPDAAIAALADAQQRSFDQATLFYRASFMQMQSEQIYKAYVRQLTALDRWLAPDKQKEQHWDVVVVPFLETPLIGQGLAFVPESRVLFVPGPLTASFVYRKAGDSIAVKWWWNRIMPEMQYTATRGDESLQNPEPTFMLTGNSRINTMLSGYSATVTTDQVLGNGYLQKAMDVCQRFHENTLPGAGQFKDPALTNKLQKEMKDLGIEMCDSSALYLYRVQQEIGHEKLTRFLQQYGQQPGEKKTLDFLQQLGQYIGRDITREAGPYICSGRSASKESTDPLQCVRNE
ncbi:hypothetical protein EI42_04744 [Thermosporothrix hazakensis]|jgi:hypothetical protein|uniref:ABC-type transport system involved in multi-copper enzyme maturation permease subunit n=2 Tax=Thermosporothrix hazakensis TaxID=644383 RepID=A0A326U253_THEHA|nr:hypothetical protein [Thermosporothrix hazakensis]PZW24053.1 hypothetical protein EI42_04744 [Thermosporothrix hazakensis]GCE50266.1 hypothetical protein KTH_51350 [Thermosporothrix hazakensis]